jgi:hypothetical protein
MRLRFVAPRLVSVRLPLRASLRLPLRASLRSPCRGTGLALCVRPPTRASASAALTQALPQGVQRLGPERISSAALARPTRVAPSLCLGTPPEQVAPSVATRSATICALLHTQRPGHATRAISAAPRRRGRAGQRLRHGGSVLWQDPPCPPLTKGSEGSPKRSAGPRMHERVAHAWDAAKPSTESVKRMPRDAAKPSTESVKRMRRSAAKPSTERIAHVSGASDKIEESHA